MVIGIIKNSFDKKKEEEKETGAEERENDYIMDLID